MKNQARKREKKSRCYWEHFGIKRRAALVVCSYLGAHWTRSRSDTHSEWVRRASGIHPFVGGASQCESPSRPFAIIWTRVNSPRRPGCWTNARAAPYTKEQLAKGKHAAATVAATDIILYALAATELYGCVFVCLQTAGWDIITCARSALQLNTLASGLATKWDFSLFNNGAKRTHRRRTHSAEWDLLMGSAEDYYCVRVFALMAAHQKSAARSAERD